VGTLLGIVILHTDSRALVLPAQLALILEQSPYDIHSLTKSLSMIVPDIDIDWSRIEFEWENLKARIPEPWKLNNDGREFMVGEKLREEGLRAKYPVVLVPGIISTVCQPSIFQEYCCAKLLTLLTQNLESWSTSPEYRSWFRQKVWGSFKLSPFMRVTPHARAYSPPYLSVVSSSWNSFQHDVSSRF
jgi:phospholipid:diacylglycerol acyltransferase